MTDFPLLKSLSTPHAIKRNATSLLQPNGSYIFAVVVLSAWNAVPMDICLANSSPPSGLCSNVIYSVRPTLTTSYIKPASHTSSSPQSTYLALLFCASQHSSIYNMLCYLLLFIVFLPLLEIKIQERRDFFSLFCSQGIPRKTLQFTVI